MDFANPGMSPERWSSYDTPHPVVAHHTAKFSWFCQTAGVGIIFTMKCFKKKVSHLSAYSLGIIVFNS